jgi:DMSO/TMAO reductase YedYZ heme-binding membrane subunit
MIAWELTRASAFVAFGCYTLSVTWGILVASRTLPAPAKPEFDFHRFLSALGLTATALHVTTVLIHHANGVHWPALFYVGARPAAIAGVTATWLIVLLPVSFALKRRGRLAARTWRRLHFLGYAVWILALLHGLGAGTDTRERASLAGYGLAAGVVITAGTWRLVSRRPKRVPARVAVPAPAAQAESIILDVILPPAIATTATAVVPTDAQPGVPGVPDDLGAVADSRERAPLTGYGLAAGLVIAAGVWRLLGRRPKRVTGVARPQPEPT